ncbi:TlpA disulfide reductase family protein [Fictibacillus gelatini]|uniref:TlpA disulfide reductase family protein n=1 Tax=Fictibacillus gelatini TaxID=225985 RepID=UPI0003FDABAA|nr:TlpA disulfide reductase family protein [Fictibacillus gelatini]
MDEYFHFGFLNVKWSWVMIAFSAAFSFCVMYFRLIRHRDAKTILNLLLNGAMIGVLTWKLSYILIHPLVSIHSPITILYFHGGSIGLIFGGLVSACYCFYFVKRYRLEAIPLLYGALTWGLSFFFFYELMSYFLHLSVNHLLLAFSFLAITAFLFTKKLYNFSALIASVLVLAFIYPIVDRFAGAHEKPPVAIATTGIGQGNLAPDFTLTTLQGKKVTLSDFKGKTVFLNLWASWCGPCRAEMPEMERFYKNYGGKKVEIVAVNLTSSDSTQNAADFAKENGITFPVLLDKNGRVGEMYKAFTIPTTYIIDQKGKIKHKYIGPMSYETMKSFLD